MKLKGQYKWENVFGSFSSSKASRDGTEDPDAVDEARLNFIEILRSAYHFQIKRGELEPKGDLHYSLFQSLDFAEDAAAKGLPLNDWEATKVASATKVVLADHLFNVFLLQLRQMWKQKKVSCAFGVDVDEFSVWMLVRQSVAFVRAHRQAQKEFEEHFASSPPTLAEEKVLEESKTQVLLAEGDLDGIDRDDVERIKGLMLCRILLNEAVQYVETLSKQNLIPVKDAGEVLEELGECIENVTICKKFDHEGRLSLAMQVDRLRQLPSDRLDEFNLWTVIEVMSERSARESLSAANMGAADDLSRPLLVE